MDTLNDRKNAGAVSGLILIGLGLMFMLSNFAQVNVLGVLWPLLIIAFGGAFFAGMVAGGKGAGGLAIPGSIFTLLGLVFFAIQVLNHWEAMSYAWSVFVFWGIGIGLLINSWWSNKPELKRGGYTMLALGSVFLLVFGAFFELLFRAGNAIGYFWPAMLIAGGALLLLGRLFDWNSMIDRLPPHSAMKNAITTEAKS
jgi:hypothetical protein